jgi:hypothetical protein
MRHRVTIQVWTNNGACELPLISGPTTKPYPLHAIALGVSGRRRPSLRHNTHHLLGKTIRPWCHADGPEALGISLLPFSPHTTCFLFPSSKASFPRFVSVWVGSLHVHDKFGCASTSTSAQTLPLYPPFAPCLLCLAFKSITVLVSTKRRADGARYVFGFARGA